jgi:hypothetical protein
VDADLAVGLDATAAWRKLKVLACAGTRAGVEIGEFEIVGVSGVDGATELGHDGVAAHLQLLHLDTLDGVGRRIAVAVSVSVDQLQLAVKVFDSDEVAASHSSS